jgi:hypothetical protein
MSLSNNGQEFLDLVDHVERFFHGDHRTKSSHAEREGAL